MDTLASPVALATPQLLRDCAFAAVQNRSGPRVLQAARVTAHVQAAPVCASPDAAALLCAIAADQRRLRLSSPVTIF